MQFVEPLFPSVARSSLPVISSLDVLCHRINKTQRTFVQTKYTVVNRDTGELYDVREIDTSMPYRYSVLPHNMRVPSKARQLLGINEQPTHVPPKAAKVSYDALVWILRCIQINVARVMSSFACCCFCCRLVHKRWKEWRYMCSGSGGHGESVSGVKCRERYVEVAVATAVTVAAVAIALAVCSSGINKNDSTNSIALEVEE